MVRRRKTQLSSAAVRAERARRQRAREELRRSRRHLVFAVVFTVLAIGVYGVENWLLSLTVAGSTPPRFQLTSVERNAVIYGSSLAFLVLGVLATRRAAAALGHLVVARSAPSAGAPLRVIATAVGYVIVFFGTLGALRIPVEHLLVGAGLAGVVLGIAGQQTLGNVFAGMVLIMARPFAVGDQIRVRSGALGGIFDAVVLGMSLTYVTLNIDGTAVKVPNSGMLAAGVGRIGGRRSGQTGPVPVVVADALAAPAATGQTGPVPVVTGQTGPVPAVTGQTGPAGAATRRAGSPATKRSQAAAPPAVAGSPAGSPAAAEQGTATQAATAQAAGAVPALLASGATPAFEPSTNPPGGQEDGGATRSSG
jgi:hypothetical protein